MRSLPLTVVSSTLEVPLDWPGSTVESGDAVNIVARLKEESEVPLRSHGSLSLNRALMAAGGRRPAGALEAKWRGMPAYMRRCGVLIRE